jgi:hypothetical protein
MTAPRKIVYARREEDVHTQYGGLLTVPLGSHWDAEDPLVRARPDLFSEDPSTGLASSHAVQRPPQVFVGPGSEVEEATANPGEKRQTRRG